MFLCLFKEYNNNSNSILFVFSTVSSTFFASLKYFLYKSDSIIENSSLQKSNCAFFINNDLPDPGIPPIKIIFGCVEEFNKSILYFKCLIIFSTLFIQSPIFYQILLSFFLHTLSLLYHPNFLLVQKLTHQ